MSREECAFKCFAVCSSFDTVIIDNLSTTLMPLIVFYLGNVLSSSIEVWFGWRLRLPEE